MSVCALARPQVGLVHICTFIMLLFSGERNFCVLMNKPFTSRLPADLPLFTGSHIDLCIIVLHKLGQCGCACVSRALSIALRLAVSRSVSICPHTWARAQQRSAHCRRVLCAACAVQL
jgi:hypothetical protein